MQHLLVPLSKLVTDKLKLDYRKRSKIEFGQFISSLRAKGKVDVPIEIYALNNGNYFIADGVHRAKAAELAGLNSVGATLFDDSRPIGKTIPLKDVGIF